MKQGDDRENEACQGHTRGMAWKCEFWRGSPAPLIHAAWLLLVCKYHLKGLDEQITNRLNVLLLVYILYGLRNPQKSYLKCLKIAKKPKVVFEDF